MRLVLRPNRMYGGVEFWLMQEAGQGSYRIAQPFDIKIGSEVYDGAFSLPEPTGRIPMHDWVSLQKSFIEEAVMQGLISDPSVEKGELKAMKEHLKDLQKYVDTMMKVLSRE
jgi:hypothetical protein